MRLGTKIKRYREDYIRFCAEQVTILPKIGPPCRLNLNPLQERINAVAEAQWKRQGFIRLVVFKARQRGGTTYSVSRACWRAFLNPNVSALIISCDDGSTINAFEKAHRIYENMDDDIRPVRRYQSKGQIVLDRPRTKSKQPKQIEAPILQSQIDLATAKNMHAGVSTTRQVMALSEMPRWSRTQEIRSSLLPAMPFDGEGTIVINEATPYGWGVGRKEFREWCDEARSGKGNYDIAELYWHLDPECRVARGKNEIVKLNREQLRWARAWKLDDEQKLFMLKMIRELGKEDHELGLQLFLQEFPGDYDSAWIESETPAFDRYKLDHLAKTTVRPPMVCRDFSCTRDGREIRAEITDAGGPFWIWEEPIDGELYDMGADCAPKSDSDRQGDFCAFTIIKRTTKEQVAEWEGHPGIFDYAAILAEVGRYYNNAHLAIEVNGIGYAVNEAVVMGDYPNIYQWRLRQQNSPKFSPLTGWKTQDDTKKLMLAVAHNFLDHDSLDIKSQRLWNQMRRYVKYYTEANNEKYEAGEGHDDILDSWMIAQVVSRDEDALGGSQSGLVIAKKLMSMAERNRELEKYLRGQNERIDRFMTHLQPGLSDKRSAEVYVKPKNDPWSNLKKAYGMRAEYDE